MIQPVHTPTPSHHNPRYSLLAGLEKTWIPLLFVVTGHLLAYAAGFHMDVPYSYYQFLDQVQLASHPFASLYLLHSQPPFFNALLTFLIHLATWPGMPSVAVLAKALFLIADATATLALFDTVRRLTASRLIAIVALVVRFADPAHYVFANTFFYPFVLESLLIGLAWSLTLRPNEPSAPLLVVSIAAIVLCVYTSALYHPLWGCACIALAWLGRMGMSSRTRLLARPATIVVGVAFLFLTLWPAKNCLLFGEFTYSTWTGYNAARGIGIIEPYFASEIGRLRDASDREMAIFRQKHPHIETAVLSDREKADGSANWNQYLLIMINHELLQKAKEYWREHPWERLALVWSDYFMCTRPPYVDPYLNNVMGPHRREYAVLAEFVAKTVYFNARPILQTVVPTLTAPVYSRTTGRLPAMTLFGLVIVPSVLLASAVRLWKRRREPTFPTMAVLVLWFSTAWIIAVPCLTDGEEANRMFFAARGLFMLLTLVALGYPRERPSKRQTLHSAGNPD